MPTDCLRPLELVEKLREQRIKREKEDQELSLRFCDHFPQTVVGKKLLRIRPIISSSGKPFPEKEAFRPSNRKVVVVVCEECAEEWNSDEREKHLKDCISFLTRRKKFPSSVMEWDSNPDGVLKRVSGRPKEQSIKRARWRRNQTNAQKKLGQSAPRLKESRIS